MSKYTWLACLIGCIVGSIINYFTYTKDLWSLFVMAVIGYGIAMLIIWSWFSIRKAISNKRKVNL